MTTQSLPPARSERGIALIAVLLLMAVMTALVTGLSMNGQVESAMAGNEMSYAGARAAAEAGMNRAIEAIVNDTTTNFLAGVDGEVDASDPGAAVNADNGSVAFLLTGAPPYTLGSQYSYTIQVVDDDDPSLYATALTAAQLVAMGEDGDPYANANDRLILRATGLGPNGTTVRLSRVLETVDSTATSTTTTTTISNPAILVNGDLTISGNPEVEGDKGNVHANGDMTISGNSTEIEGDATATGDFSANDGWHAGGTQGGGMPTVNVPEVDANDYADLATHILNADGTMTTVATGGVSVCPCNDWSFSGGTWSITGNSATTGAYFVNGDAHISGNPGSSKSPVALTVIATGSIEVSGNPYLRPYGAAEALQFVTNGDLKLGGNVDIDVATVEGQSLVREQLMISGNPDIRGQIIVQNVESVSDLVTDNTISGNPSITYDGSFGDLITTTTTTTTGPTTYVNNVSGWIEG